MRNNNKKKIAINVMVLVFTFVPELIRYQITEKLTKLMQNARISLTTSTKG